MDSVLKPAKNEFLLVTNIIFAIWFSITEYWNVMCWLKIDEFSHEHFGQLKTYVNYYKKEIMCPDDNPPVGILLVTDKDHALVEYATADSDKDIFVSKYLLELPSKEKLIKFIKSEISKF